MRIIDHWCCPPVGDDSVSRQATVPSLIRSLFSEGYLCFTIEYESQLIARLATLVSRLTYHDSALARYRYSPPPTV
jgi:hypothetical protein